MKPSATLQDRLVKQNEISRQRLQQELVKLDKVEKSDLKMIETARHRFRTRHKNLDVSRLSGSNAINVRMYETHNPGFCYHCTGAIKEIGRPNKQQTSKDSYEFVRSIVFTKGEVDIDKVLCLHLLTAHSTKWNGDDTSTVRPVTTLLEKAKNNHFSGAWNNILPCYVVDLQAERNDMKLHENPAKQCLEEQAIRAFEEKYKQYLETNSDYDNVLSTKAKHATIALRSLQKPPSISPHVYSLLGPSHELRIKQALARGVAKRKLTRSSMDLTGVEEPSISIRFNENDYEDDDLISRATTLNASNRNWGTRSVRSPSRRSTVDSSLKHNSGITMLKSRRRKNVDTVTKDLITIKSSFTRMAAMSKTSSIRSPFRGTYESRRSSNSFLSSNSPDSSIKRFGRCVYLNAPIQSVELRDRQYRIVPILVNYQLQALVQTVIEVLVRVNPEKSRKIIELARDTERIKKMLTRSEVLNFAQSLLGQSLVSSPDSFVISVATLANEIDVRLEENLEKEVIALTLEIPSIPPLETLIVEIRRNVFHDTKKTTRTNEIARKSPPDMNKLRATAMYKSKKERAESFLNSTDLGNKSKIFNSGGPVPTTNKNKTYSRKRLTMFQTPSRSSKQPESLKNVEIHQRKRNSGRVHEDDDYIVNKSREDNVTHGAEVKREWSLKKSSTTKSSEHSRNSGSINSRHNTNFKSWKTAQDVGHLDTNRVILRRMTNPQRILVGQMCASLKTRQINNEGLIDESVPLAALITPALSRDCIKFLTRGTVYSKTNTSKKQEETESNVTVPDKLTGPLLAKIRQDVAESETKQRLKCFLDEVV